VSGPFHFHTSVKLPEYTGRCARTVSEILDGIRSVDGSSIFHHTYHFLYQHQFATPHPSSDFAYWVGQILLDHGLAERLAALNPVEFSTIRALRERLIEVIEEHRAVHDCSTRAPDGMNFYYMRANSAVVPLPHVAHDLREFAVALEGIPLGSIYHHMFEARLRLENGSNDFALWLEDSQGRASLARKVVRLDPGLMNLVQIRDRVQTLVREELKKL
jgi:hypothetical protein